MSEKTSVMWKRYPEEMKAKALYRAALVKVLIGNGVWPSEAPAGHIIKTKIRGTTQVRSFVTTRGLEQLAKHRGIAIPPRPRPQPHNDLADAVSYALNYCREHQPKEIPMPDTNEKPQEFAPVARVISVVETTLTRRGSGVFPDPIRVVVQYWTPAGVLLAEKDPCADDERSRLEADRRTLTEAVEEAHQRETTARREADAHQEARLRIAEEANQLDIRLKKAWATIKRMRAARRKK